jgi:hypothetical protein
MKRLNNLWFGALLTLSILFVVWAFTYAQDFRGSNAVGGEVFTIALPLTLVWLKLRAMGQKIMDLKMYNKELKRHLW